VVQFVINCAEISLVVPNRSGSATENVFRETRFSGWWPGVGLFFNIAFGRSKESVAGSYTKALVMK
jgi:hypothetical protein